MRWLRLHEPEDLVNWLWITEPCAYEKDMNLVERMDYYENYAKRI